MLQKTTNDLTRSNYISQIISMKQTEKNEKKNERKVKEGDGAEHAIPIWFTWIKIRNLKHKFLWSMISFAWIPNHSQKANVPTISLMHMECEIYKQRAIRPTKNPITTTIKLLFNFIRNGLENGQRAIHSRHTGCRNFWYFSRFCSSSVVFCLVSIFLGILAASQSIEFHWISVECVLTLQRATWKD